jgi:hypothetical protein
MKIPSCLSCGGALLELPRRGCQRALYHPRSVPMSDSNRRQVMLGTVT